jgi:transcriptional regulator with XRE-family HTH domain
MTATPANLQPVPAEPIGRKISRVRELCGLSLDDSVELLSQYQRVSPSTLSRIERSDFLSGPRAETAIVFLLTLGYDPASIGLSMDLVPPLKRRSIEAAMAAGGLDVGRT